MEGRININVSAVDYDKTSDALTRQLAHLEEMVHGEDEFAMTDSEFAFGWHFFVLSVNRSMVEKLAEMMGEDFERNLEGKTPRFKLAIKEEMESSKFGVF
ncbi:MAG: hypothetical protein EB828_02650 [Nitrosopumilus sp. D6]|nr:MAG: hypothetical protein EB828_02650 [Nitrosopumilus sp. D6]